MNKEFTKTPDELIAEVLGRFTVTDLREMDDNALDRGFRQYDKTLAEVKVTGKGEVNLIKYWDISSNGKQYQVRRFENFVWCSCRDFFFRKQVCRHIYVTTKDFDRYQRKCAALSPYLKESNYKPERVGSVRI